MKKEEPGNEAEELRENVRQRTIYYEEAKESVRKLCM